MINIYMTAFGDVRVSEREARLLTLEEDIRRAGLDVNPAYQPVLLKAGMLRADCERVAQHKNGWLD